MERRVDTQLYSGIGIHREATLHIVIEEEWSISSKASERQLLSSSERPLFSGGAKVVACAYAKKRASDFNYHGVHDNGDRLYWSEPNEGDRVNRRFVVKPAPPSPPLLVDKDGRPRGRPSRHAQPTAVTVNAPGALIPDDQKQAQWRIGDAGPPTGAPAREARCTLAARALRCGAMSAAFVLIIVVALLCVALLVLFGLLWAALHFGVGEDDDD
jgi:hypothetical protein